MKNPSIKNIMAKVPADQKSTALKVLTTIEELDLWVSPDTAAKTIRSLIKSASYPKEKAAAVKAFLTTEWHGVLVSFKDMVNTELCPYDIDVKALRAVARYSLRRGVELADEFKEAGLTSGEQLEACKFWQIVQDTFERVPDLINDVPRFEQTVMVHMKTSSWGIHATCEEELHVKDDATLKRSHEPEIEEEEHTRNEEAPAKRPRLQNSVERTSIPEDEHQEFCKSFEESCAAVQQESGFPDLAAEEDEKDTGLVRAMEEDVRIQEVLGRIRTALPHVHIADDGEVTPLMPVDVVLRRAYEFIKAESGLMRIIVEGAMDNDTSAVLQEMVKHKTKGVMVKIQPDIDDMVEEMAMAATDVPLPDLEGVEGSWAAYALLVGMVAFDMNVRPGIQLLLELLRPGIDFHVQGLPRPADRIRCRDICKLDNTVALTPKPGREAFWSNFLIQSMKPLLVVDGAFLIEDLLASSLNAGVIHSKLRARLCGQVHDMNKKIYSLEKTSHTVLSALFTLQGRKSEAESVLQSLVDDCDATNTEYENTIAKLDSTRAKLQSARNELEHAHKELDNHHRDLKAANRGTTQRPKTSTSDHCEI